MYSSGELFMRLRHGYVGVYFPSCAVIREINNKITLEWAHEQLVARVHTLFHFLQNEYIHDIVPVSHLLGLRSADDVTIDWWWLHNNQKIVTRAREVISDSLDIDFIHGNIQDRSCKR